MSEPAAPELEALQRSFNACDPNGDGRIDVNEFHQLLMELDGDVSRAECELDFQLVDADEDGYISFGEFAAWWTG
jgi:Ca2+-binding EF-hand superfamily protein